MTDEPGFHISIPIEPPCGRLSDVATEQILLQRLHSQERVPDNILWKLAEFYASTGRREEARMYVERLLVQTEDHGLRAHCYLKFGQLMEKDRNYERAIAYYRQAFSLEPLDNSTWYFINNNLGYCLNHFGGHAEAEPYCRAAIGIDPLRHNAYKNLGIAQEGLGQIADAARSYIKALQTEASDPRALLHLEKMVAEHTDIVEAMPDIAHLLWGCREAVRVAAELRQNPPERPQA